MPLAGRKVRLLAEIPLFSACTRRELSKIASIAKWVTAEPGETLTQEGGRGTEFYVIEGGTAEVRVGGRRRAELGPGDYFGELALLDQGPRTATVTARTPMSLYVISAEDFGRMLEEVPFVGRRILRGLATRLRHTDKSPSYVWNRL